MPKAEDLSGQKFGKLIAIKRVPIKEKGRMRTYWLCQCECGNDKLIMKDNLKKGVSKSCGCIVKTKNGLGGSRINKTYSTMIDRCYKETRYDFHRYGGRGISVCDEWRNDFWSFYFWAIHNGYSNQLTIDRINVNGNYEPSNCRWATMKQQNNNRRSNKYITINNVTKTLQEWSDLSGIGSGTINNRYNKGLRGEMLLFKGKIKSITDLVQA